MHKVLGITLCNNFYVNVTKSGAKTPRRLWTNLSCKRLYLLRVLKRAGDPPDHLITVYCALMCRDAGRSVLRLAIFRQWPFYNNYAFLYSLNSLCIIF